MQQRVSTADRVHGAVNDNPWVETVTKVGWIAKGVIYSLMGVTALQIARSGDTPASGAASPEGSIGRVGAATGGRVLLVVLAIGLAMYIVWRVLSVIVISGNSLSAWADRIGYTVSALSYVTLTLSAVKGATSDSAPSDPNTIERVSTSLLESTVGRAALFVLGLIFACVGVYFIVNKAIRRSFVDDVQTHDDPTRHDDELARWLVISGIIGWIGRGMVTMLVGFFILRAAIRFDPGDARGFDRSLRAIAGSGWGSALVSVCAFGLIAYGVFCFISYRYRSLATAAESDADAAMQ